MHLKFLIFQRECWETPIIERPKPKPSTLVEPIDASCEKQVDDLEACVKHVVFGD
jgi:hypothetical protein